MATTVNDKAMYVVLVLSIVAGLCATALGSGVVGEAYNYRETVSVCDLDPAAPGGSDRRGANLFPDPRDHRADAVLLVAVHPIGSRVQRTHRLPLSTVRGVPQSGCSPKARASGIPAPSPRLVTVSVRENVNSRTNSIVSYLDHQPVMTASH